MPPFPFTFQQATHCTLKPDRTYTLHNLVEGLAHVPGIGPLAAIDRGLRIANVFRNKEGHVVVPRHTFDPANYRDMEFALVALYERAFGETLKIRFSVARGEKGDWRIQHGHARYVR